jgi:starch phosphorylase
MVAVTLLHRKGYFYQRIDEDGWQREEPVEWVVDDFLKETPNRVSVTIEGRAIHLRSWRYGVVGLGGFTVPVYFLDSDLPENSDTDRLLTYYLYGGDQRYRLCQEVILGIGGVRMLRALGYNSIERFHMNEGHASLLALELLDEEARVKGNDSFTQEDIDYVKKKCVFTTHTPVPAGHDQFPMELVNSVIDRREINEMKEVFCCEDFLNMTYLALNLSHYINGVAKKHGEISRHMFAGYTIDAITNGVHAPTWVAKHFQDLFDKHIPGWRQDNFSLRYALSIPKQELWETHKKAKMELIEYVNRETNTGMDLDFLTLGFARRATPYKRADLIFTDTERLKSISSNVGPIQIVYAGKAHPNDNGGKEMIKKIFQMKHLLRPSIKIAYLENYDIELAGMITSGVDIWVNTPQPPLEASGTSGMKAALNGIPSFSILDGWWIEGCIENITGWSIGEDSRKTITDTDQSLDASSLYEKLEKVILPLFYTEQNQFIDVMRHSIALNGSFFNTQRMLLQYVLRAYFL